jgi:nicotinate-nucleotide adenylyltransferase
LSGLGLLGGTFDPPHFGHIELAASAKRELSLRKIIFIPAKIPPHKTDIVVTDSNVRLEMLKIALKGYTDFEISDIELKREKVSYTFDTIRQTKAEYPEENLYFIIGADNIPELETWYKPEQIIKLAKIAVAQRPGFKKSGKYDKFLVKFNMEPKDVSSTQIRNKVKNNESLDGLLPERLIGYIKRNNLYV